MVFVVFSLVFVFVANFLALMFFSALEFGYFLGYFKYLLALFVPLGVLSSFSGGGGGIYLLKKERMFVNFVLVSLFVVFTFGFLPLSFSNVVQNIQFIYVFYVAFFSGWFVYFLVGKGKQYDLAAVCLVVGVVACAFGFVETILGETFWHVFDLHNYYSKAMGFDDPLSPEFGIPRGWVSWDFYEVTGEGFVRMVSFFVEPVGFGRFMGVALLFVFWLVTAKKISFNKGVLLSLAFLLCMVLSVSKGAFVTLALFLFAMKFGATSTLFCFSVFSIGAVFIVSVGLGQLLGPSIANHLASVVHAVDLLVKFPMGLGLNVDDVLVVREYSEVQNDFLKQKSEGGLALYSLFLGVPGILVYFHMLYSVSAKTSYSDERYLSCMCLAVLLSGVFAHSAFSLVGGGVVFMIYGYLRALRGDYEERYSCKLGG